MSWEFIQLSACEAEEESVGRLAMVTEISSGVGFSSLKLIRLETSVSLKPKRGRRENAR